MRHDRTIHDLICLKLRRVFVATDAYASAWLVTGETTTAGPGVTGTGRGLVFYTLRAEGVGFEPTNRGYLLAVFKTAAIGH